jgi:hypothetical protein
MTVGQAIEWIKPEWGFRAWLTVSGLLSGPETATPADITAALQAMPTENVELILLHLVEHTVVNSALEEAKRANVGLRTELGDAHTELAQKEEQLSQARQRIEELERHPAFRDYYRELALPSLISQAKEWRAPINAGPGHPASTAMVQASPIPQVAQGLRGFERLVAPATSTDDPTCARCGLTFSQHVMESYPPQHAHCSGYLEPASPPSPALSIPIDPEEWRELTKDPGLDSVMALLQQSDADPGVAYYPAVEAFRTELIAAFRAPIRYEPYIGWVTDACAHPGDFRPHTGATRRS